jgi:uncharacterized protein YbaP (TraB family)
MNAHQTGGRRPREAPARRAARLFVTATLIVASTMGSTRAASRNFLWKISGRQTAVYLVGSVHMLTKDYYPLNPALDAAFKDSDLLVEEADLGELLSSDSQFRMLSRGMLPSDQSLEKVVSRGTFAEVSRRVGGLGLPIEPLQRFKPWMLALTLEGLEWQKAGFEADLGLDKHFYDRAHTDSKPVQGLETADYQISRFDGMTFEQQDRLLADTLKGLDTEMGSVSTLADAWKAGDAPAVERIVLADLKQDPVMYQRLLVERNQNWMPKLEALFTRRGRAFVVVGAAHLVGPDGLLSLLRAKGYIIEQL